MVREIEGYSLFIRKIACASALAGAVIVSLWASTASAQSQAVKSEATAGLDSEQGRSLNFTCREGATGLLVDSGERERLVELQTLSLRKTASE